MEAKTAALWSQSKEPLEPQEAARGQEGFPLQSPWGERGPADTLIQTSGP